MQVVIVPGSGRGLSTNDDLEGLLVDLERVGAPPGSDCESMWLRASLIIASGDGSDRAIVVLVEGVLSAAGDNQGVTIHLTVTVLGKVKGDAKGIIRRMRGLLKRSGQCEGVGKQIHSLRIRENGCIC